MIEDIIGEIIFIIIGIILLIWSVESYHDDDDAEAGGIFGFIMIIISIICLTNSIGTYNKSDTAKKYDEYIELRKEKEKDSIRELHYKWNKDLNNKIKKLKDE